MSDKNLYMMGVMLEKRDTEAPDVQEVFTRYGNCILSRFGIHQFDDPNGLISLNVRTDEDNLRKFEDELTSIKGVTAKHILLK